MDSLLVLAHVHDVTLSNAVGVTQTVTVGDAGNLISNRALTLLSSASGTALLVNNGSGVVSGDATVQRYINASGNAGARGYRHYATPVTRATVASFQTGTFTPLVNPAYNTAPNTQALPASAYPTVYSYNQSRVGSPTLATNLTAFDQGYLSPNALSAPLIPGQGYTVQIGNNELVSFTGTPITGNQSISGLNNSGATDAGWALIGNPYPAPLDWGTVTTNQLPNVSRATYVFQSTNAYAGRYTSFVNGVGVGTGLIATGQAFFMRATAVGGSVNLTNANRVNSFSTTSKFQRTAETRLLVGLALGKGSAPATDATAQDETFVYFEPGATADFDGKFDAYKLANPSGYYLGTAATMPAGTHATGLSINGRAPLTTGAADLVPVWLSVPAGTYSLTATKLLNFVTAGIQVQLRDGLKGTLTNLSDTPSYSFTVAANEASTGRFSLVFGIASALATVPNEVLNQALATVFPNPTGSQDNVTLALTGLPQGARSVEATMVNALGQVMSHAILPVAAGSVRARLATQGLTGGVYILNLRVQDAQGQIMGSLPAQRLSLL